MMRCVFAVLVLLVAARGVAGPAEFGVHLIEDARGRLAGLKDPAVIEVRSPMGGGGKERILILGDYGREAFRAFRLVGHEAREEIALELPPLAKGETRWAPCALVRGDTIWLYYAKGNFGARGIDWPSFRIYTTSADLRTARLRPGSGVPWAIRFGEEQVLELLDEDQFAEGADYGIIDPEIFADDGQLYIYYVVMFDGIPKVRHRSSPIHSQRMRSPTEPYGPEDDVPAWEGRDRALDGGVSEAPAVMKWGDRYLMIYSSFPTDWDQRIVALTSDRPHGGKWENRRVVYASNVEAKPLRLATASWERHGVGGQCLFVAGEGPLVYYQGLGVVGSDGHARFHQGVMEGLLAVLEEPAAP